MNLQGIETAENKEALKNLIANWADVEKLLEEHEEIKDDPERGDYDFCYDKNYEDRSWLIIDISKYDDLMGMYFADHNGKEVELDGESAQKLIDQMELHRDKLNPKNNEARNNFNKQKN